MKEDKTQNLVYLELSEIPTHCKSMDLSSVALLHKSGYLWSFEVGTLTTHFEKEFRHENSFIQKGQDSPCCPLAERMPDRW